MQSFDSTSVLNLLCLLYFFFSFHVLYSFHVAKKKKKEKDSSSSGRSRTKTLTRQHGKSGSRGSHDKGESADLGEKSSNEELISLEITQSAPAAADHFVGFSKLRFKQRKFSFPNVQQEKQRVAHSIIDVCVGSPVIFPSIINFLIRYSKRMILRLPRASIRNQLPSKRRLSSS